MTIEKPNQPEGNENSGNEPVVHIAPDGQQWYRDAAGQIVILDEAGMEERERQQMDPDSAPADGFPKFARRVSLMDVPASDADPAPAPTEHTDTAGATVPEDTPDEPSAGAPPRAPEPVLAPEPAREPRTHETETGRAHIPRPLTGDGLQELHRRLENRPQWAGKYFDNSKEKVEYVDFDPGTYADIIPKSIPEIRSNPEHAQLFGDLLTALNPTESIWEKVAAEQPLDDRQRKFLDYAQHEFTRQLAHAEEAVKYLKPETMKALYAQNDSLRQFTNVTGQEPSADAFKAYLKTLAMRDKGSFEKFYKAQKSLGDLESTRRAAKSEKEINAICERMGIPRQNYGTLFGGSGSAVRAKVTERIHERAGKARKGLDWLEKTLHVPIVGSSRSAALMNIREAGSAAPTKFDLRDPRSWVTSKINDMRNDVASVMADAVANPEFRQIAERLAFTGQKSQEVTATGPKNAAEAQSAASDISQEALQTFYDRHKASARTIDGRGWDKMTQEERIDSRDNKFNPPEVQKIIESKGTGFWASMGRALARIIFGERKKALSVA